MWFLLLSFFLFFSDAKAEKTLLSCDTSVAKLIQILEKKSFESGAHIDYYDEIWGTSTVMLGIDFLGKRYSQVSNTANIPGIMVFCICESV